MTTLRVNASGRIAGEHLRDDFLAVVSHELRTPLAAIKGFVDLLIGDDTSNLTAEQREYLTIVAYNARRQVRAVDQLLEYAYIRSGQAVFSLAAIDIRELLERSAAPIGDASIRRHVVSVVCDRCLPPVLADGDRVLQILGLLLDHAAERVANGGSIRVTATIEQHSVCVEVRDTGPAISPAHRDRLFIGFNRAEQFEPSGGDPLGLNLAIARGLARLQGGDLYLRSGEESGAALCLTLPICDVDETAGE